MSLQDMVNEIIDDEVTRKGFLKENPMSTPHPHADILRAIADGKEIETLSSGQTHWLGCGDDYFFLKCKEIGRKFRVKPETKTFWLFIYNDGEVSRYDTIPKNKSLDVAAIKEITYTPGEGL